MTKRWIVLIAGTALLVLFVLPAQLAPGHFLPDDTYYYLQVAYNIVGGHGSTFNRIMPTNGYHPLWMLFCVAGMVLAGGDKAAALHIILLIQALLFLGIASFFIRVAREIGLRYWMVGLPILALYFLTGLYGSEAHINALMVLVGLYYLVRAAIDGRRRDWVLAGVFAGLAVLARLDNVFLVAAIAVVGIPAAGTSAAGASAAASQGAAGRRSTARDVLAFLLPAILVVSPYLIYNLVAFGHIVPISGAIKSSFPSVTFNIARLATLGQLVTLFGALGLALSFTGPARRRMVLRALSVAVLLQSAYIAMFLEFGAGWSWYYVFGVLNAAYVTAVVADAVASRIGLRRPAVARWVAGTFVALMLVAGVGRSWLKLAYPYGMEEASYDIGARYPDLRQKLGVWMKYHLPQGSGVMVEEGAGALGYYSDLRILPLDGLVADYAYNDELLRLGGARYLALHDVGYFVGTEYRSDSIAKRANIVAPLYRRVAGTLTLPPESVVVTMPEESGAWLSRMTIWKIAAP